MALQTQTVAVVFNQGIDTKTDPKLVAQGKLLELQNAVFTKIGILSKRNGYTQLPTSILTGGAISAAKALSVHNDELLLFTGSRAYSWAPASYSWVDRGAAVSVAVSAEQIIHNSYAQANPDVGINAGIRVVAWEDQRGGVRCSVQDTTTGVFYQSDVQVSNIGTRPRVVAFGTDLVIFYSASNNLYYRRVATSQPQTLVAEINPVSTLVSGAPNFDALVVSAKLFVAWNDSGGVAKLAALDSTYSLSSTVSQTLAATNAIALFAGPTSSGGVGVICANATDVRFKLWTYTLSSASGTASVETISNVARVTGFYQGDSTSLIYIFYDVNDVTTNNPSRQVTRYSTTNTTTGVTSAAADFKRSVGLVASPFTYGGNWYIGLGYLSGLQSTYFVVDATTGGVIARLSPGNAGGLRSKPTLSAVVLDTGTEYELAGTTGGKLVAQSGAVYAIQGVTTWDLDFTAADTFQTTRLGNNLILASGLAQAYDGVSFTEAGFHLYPEKITADSTSALVITVAQQGTGILPEKTNILCVDGSRIAGGQYFTISSVATNYYVWFTVDGVGTDPAVFGKTGVPVAVLSTDTSAQVCSKLTAVLNVTAGLSAVVDGGIPNQCDVTNTANGNVTDAANAAAPNGVATGSLTAATYGYVAIYEWTDNYGQTHRSAGSLPLSVVVPGPPLSVTISIPTLRITTRDGVTRQPVRVVVYRTQANQAGVYYRVTPLTSPTYNSTHVDAVTFLDTYSDATIATAEILYTVGGLLDSTPPPAATLCTTFKNRIILAGEEDPLRLHYSTIAPQGEPAYFSDALTMTLPANGGAITGLAAMDDKLVIFKASSIYYITGNGPTNAGQQDDFSEPTLVTSDAGCNNPNSIVLAPAGLIFQTPKGLYLLDRSMAVSYLGDNVEAYNSSTIEGVAMVPNTNQIRFVINGNEALVYDYLFDQWATFTGHKAADCDVWRGGFVFVRPTGEVMVETAGIYTDAGSPIRMRVTTGWLAFAGIEGFQRCRNLTILGEYRGAHTLRVSVATDYNPAFLQTQNIDATTAVVAGTAFGAISPYGAESVFGGKYAPYQFQMHLWHQKCQAIRVRIEDAQSSSYNEGYALNAIQLEAGIKGGPMRVPVTRSF